MRFFSWIRAAAFIACLTPLGLLGVYAYNGNLGANPIEVITHWTGTSTLIFLLITLSVTPLRRITGLPWLIKLRRMLGLYAFFYASLHFTTYIWLDQFFDLSAIVKDVAKRPFITAGFTSFVLLIPLALTSTSGMIRCLGRHWQRLHRLIYLVAIGGVAHYLWLVKADIFWPLVYGAVLTLLLGFRAVLSYGKRSVAEPGIKAKKSSPALYRVLPFFLLLTLFWGGIAWSSSHGPGRGLPAPEISGKSWINSRPLTLATLRGKVVMVEFWTYG